MEMNFVVKRVQMTAIDRALSTKYGLGKGNEQGNTEVA